MKPIQPSLFSDAPAPVAARAAQSAQAVALYEPSPVARPRRAVPVAVVEQAVTAAAAVGPEPDFDCWLHWPPVRSRWYRVGGRWTCAVCHPKLRVIDLEGAGT